MTLQLGGCRQQLIHQGQQLTTTLPPSSKDICANTSVKMGLINSLVPPKASHDPWYSSTRGFRPSKKYLDAASTVFQLQTPSTE